MEANSVEIENLTFSHRRDGDLFRNLSLNLAPGHVYGLLGRNGAGKTTLLRLMAGLLFSGEGSCRLFDREAAAREPDALARTYYVAEEMDAPPLPMSAYMELYAPFYPEFDQALFFRYLTEFELSPGERLSELSHGQRKAFYISFALATNARLLIFDEPTNGLDIPAKSRFRKLLVGAIEPTRTIIISTHQVRDIRNLIDPVLILDQGRIIFRQSMEDVGRRISLYFSQAEPDAKECLYYEPTIGGFAVLNEASLGGGNIDLEVLFNAVLRDPARFDAIFGGAQ